jgi:hypothetical protein
MEGSEEVHMRVGAVTPAALRAVEALQGKHGEKETLLVLGKVLDALLQERLVPGQRKARRSRWEDVPVKGAPRAAS